jgi:tetratricopeptide (TPR) repeat protein
MTQPTDPGQRDSVREHGALVVVPIAAAAERRRRNKALEDFRRLEDLTKTVADEPDGDAQFTFLGNLRFIAGEYEDAIRSFSRALSLRPTTCRRAPAALARGRRSSTSTSRSQTSTGRCSSRPTTRISTTIEGTA